MFGFAITNLCPSMDVYIVDLLVRDIFDAILCVFCVLCMYAFMIVLKYMCIFIGDANICIWCFVREKEILR